ncbi:hypothetical protein K7X08_008769 [Anisodus acutangulus]|uniref:Uncharacterized protein n=1 Tax=Anisodus acutangulus TaxID=402998 RepID=A0A9Q1RU36_9SOLA|nr:hypothetical protein K7X08_008769 [Anisodus acutangulus]
MAATSSATTNALSEMKHESTSRKGQSSAKYGSTSNVKIDLYDEYTQNCSMNKEVYCEQSKKQRKQSILVEKKIRRLEKKSNHKNLLYVTLLCNFSKRLFPQLEIETKFMQNGAEGSSTTAQVKRNKDQQLQLSIGVMLARFEDIAYASSGQSSAKDGSMNNVKIDLYDEYKQKCSMNKEAYCEQRKQSILVERQVQKKIHRSHSDNAICLSHDEKKPRKKLTRSATVGCRKVIKTDSVKPAMTMTTTSYPEDEISNDEFRKTVENFIARQQRFLREEEFSAVVSYET